MHDNASLTKIVAFLLALGMTSLLATPQASSTRQGQGPGGAVAPCSNTGVKQTADSKTIVTTKSTDCNGDGTMDCGYEEFYWPKIFGCDTPGSMSGHCCRTFVDFSQKRTFTCDGTACITQGWLNDQAFTQAMPVPCNAGQQNTDCTK